VTAPAQHLCAALADDEPPARRLLAELLEEVPEVEVVGEAADGEEVVRLVRRHVEEGQPLDLLFLDVQMPGLDGFGALEGLAGVGVPLPHVVFTTAYDRHAVRAFEAGAVDYLLKPLALSRLRVAVRRVVERKRPQEAEEIAAVTTAARQPDCLLVRAGDRLVAVDPSEILWVEAAGNYAELHTRGRTYLAGIGIGEVEQRLPAERFIRVHRSALIALPALRQLQSDGSGGYVALLEGGHRVRVSRSYAERLRRLVL
jgi:two-component system LytT family response regulator